MLMLCFIHISNYPQLKIFNCYNCSLVEFNASLCYKVSILSTAGINYYHHYNVSNALNFLIIVELLQVCKLRTVSG